MDIMVNNDIKIDVKKSEILVRCKTVSLVNFAKPEQLDTLKRHINKLEEAKLRTIYHIQANEDKKNESMNCTYSYKVNSKVYVRSTNKGELDSRYEVPFQTRSDDTSSKSLLEDHFMTGSIPRGTSISN
ncbi:hypothetical protein RF11_06068 [Thelohanellus kitauei]|uniref:Uncharacterized protein n=1 Tax=Thelohanellus kitauei TaxID=669202 RepID=A0A0C2N9T2_THEKT|nr:hypothetical protein RF11_06068 [Thelohanellus kitauei]